MPYSGCVTAHPAPHKVASCFVRRHRLRCMAPIRQSVVVQAAVSTCLPDLLPLDDEFGTRHAFTSYANWIVPGYVMLGRYPFVEPSRCVSRDIGEAQLQQILGAGVTTFVSLQEEVGPQETLPARGEAGFLPYKATADLIAASLSGPPPPEVVEGLRNPYLDKFVPERRRQASESYRAYKPLRPHFARMPITDLSVPAEQPLAVLLDDLEDRLELGQKLYIHCWGGRGRAGMVGACLLVKLYGIPVEEALQRVQQAFNQRGDHKDRSPETEEQVAFVKRFCGNMHTP